MVIVIEKLSISSLISLFFKIKKLQANNKNRVYYYVFIDKYMIYVKKIIELLFSLKITLSFSLLLGSLNLDLAIPASILSTDNPSLSSDRSIYFFIKLPSSTATFL